MADREKVPKSCAIDNCKNKVIARGVCHKHYKRWQINGEYNLLKKDYPCSKDGCTKKHYAKGLCSRHFNQLKSQNGYTATVTRKPQTRYTDSKRHARYKNLEWTITYEEYTKLLDNSCTYCNGPLPVTRVGLDRKDNHKGYTLDNVVPCCKYCNQMRSNIFSFEEFKEFAKTDLFKTVLNRLHHKIVV